MTTTLRIAVPEPYYGGSHAGFVDAFRKHSRHRCTLATLPARKWKWRMRGAAIWFTREACGWTHDEEGRGIDLILCSDMLSVCDLRALLPVTLRRVPIVCYFHENQLTYPIPDEDQRDFQYGMTNVTSCLAADAVWFNSRFHLDGFLEAAQWLLRKMPDCVPCDVIQTIRCKSAVFPPAVEVTPVRRPRTARSGRTIILWCHRWEYDKNPEPFFKALARLDEAGCEFDLVLIGEQFRVAPQAFESAWDRLAGHVVHAGFIADRAEYRAMLSRCDVVVSTAIQENFGIAVVEAILAGCQPLLPDRLSYPEIIPRELHAPCLYAKDGVLAGRLGALLDGNGWLAEAEMLLLQDSLVERFGVEPAIGALDDALAEVADVTTGRLSEKGHENSKVP